MADPATPELIPLDLAAACDIRLASADVDEHRLIIVDGRAEKIIRGASTACRQSDRRRGGPTEPKPVLEVADNALGVLFQAHHVRVGGLA